MYTSELRVSNTKISPHGEPRTTIRRTIGLFRRLGRCKLWQAWCTLNGMATWTRRKSGAPASVSMASSQRRSPTRQISRTRGESTTACSMAVLNAPCKLPVLHGSQHQCPGSPCLPTHTITQVFEEVVGKAGNHYEGPHSVWKGRRDGL